MSGPAEPLYRGRIEAFDALISFVEELPAWDGLVERDEIVDKAKDLRSRATAARQSAPATVIDPDLERIVGCPHCGEDFALSATCCYGKGGHDESEPHHVDLQSAPSHRRRGSRTHVRTRGGHGAALGVARRMGR